MGYHVIDPAAVEPTPDRPCVRRSISDAVGLERLGLHVYEPAPGEQIPLAYHVHEEQEEAFYVCEGRLAVETPGETYAVEAGQWFVADPESPHRAFVPGDANDAATVVAVGAPPVDDVRPYEPER